MSAGLELGAAALTTRRLGQRVRLIAGGALLATAYGAMAALSGMRRGWLAAAPKPGHGA